MGNEYNDIDKIFQMIFVLYILSKQKKKIHLLILL